MSDPDALRWEVWSHEGALSRPRLVGRAATLPEADTLATHLRRQGYRGVFVAHAGPG